MRCGSVEAIGEVFNLFNSQNPDGFVTRRYTGTIAGPAPNPTFMQPTASRATSVSRNSASDRSAFGSSFSQTSDRAIPKKRCRFSGGSLSFPLL